MTWAAAMAGTFKNASSFSRNLLPWLSICCTYKKSLAVTSEIQSLVYTWSPVCGRFLQQMYLYLCLGVVLSINLADLNLFLHCACAFYANFRKHLWCLCIFVLADQGFCPLSLIFSLVVSHLHPGENRSTVQLVIHDHGESVQILGQQWRESLCAHQKTHRTWTH